MKLSTFVRKFPSERACILAFRDFRLQAGVVCPKCGCTVHYFSMGKTPKFQCKICGYQQSLKSNTILHKSKLSFRTWFIAFHLLTTTNNSFSAAELQRQLGMTYYRPIWQCIHKIRNAMGIVEKRHKLSGNVEIDEAFYSVQKIKKELPLLNADKKQYKHKKPYIITKSTVVVMAESLPLKSPKKRYKINRVCGNLKMIVVPNLKVQTLNDVAVSNIEDTSTLWSDGTSCHKDFPLLFDEYIGEKIKPENLSKVLPWVHISIGNSKAQIRNVHHCVKENYLQMYLNEFCYKFNRRKSKNLFEQLVIDMCTIKNELMLNKHTIPMAA